MSYAHFYHQEFYTSYGTEENSDVHLAPGIMREFVFEETLTGTASTTQVIMNSGWYGGPIVTGSLRVYVNDVWQLEGVDYNADLDTGLITWKPGHEPVKDDVVKVIYKLWKHIDSSGQRIDAIDLEDPPGIPHLYDVAQIISSDGKYVGFKAFWPTLSDYTVDGWTVSLEPLINVSVPDIIPFEPEIPFIIGEWDFMLGKGYPLQFRGVEVVGLTDYHDADDIQAAAEDFDGDGKANNTIDREVQYQLDEVFEPWDLISAVHKKDTKRWVQFDSTTSTVTSIQLEHLPFHYVSDNMWDQYAVFSERVEDLTTGKVLNRYEGDYEVTSGGLVYDLPKSHDYKILYSTNAYLTDTIALSDQSTDYATLAAAGNFDATVNGGQYYYESYDALGVGHDFDVYLNPYNVTLANAEANWTWSGYIYEWAGWEQEDFKVFKSETYNSTVHIPPMAPLSLSTQNFTISNFSIHSIEKSVTAPQHETVHVFDLDHWIGIYAYLSYNTVSNQLTITTEVRVLASFSESLEPRYEWTIVGRDAASVDSVGASLVTAAFKNKQKGIGTAGVDIMDPMVANQIPWVMYNFTTGTTKDNYKDTLGRAALVDDWCTYWPVTSSNMIGVGGPIANMLSYYGNDFTDAFYGIPAYTPSSVYSGLITGITDWNRGWNGTWNVYESSESTGYATISTYLDINGTELFLVWGHWGRDTFYASQWLHGDEARGIPPGIEQLQEAPLHLTSIIIEIDYDDPKHPTFRIVEALGTITEFYWEHAHYDGPDPYWWDSEEIWIEEKGGIHDP